MDSNSDFKNSKSVAIIVIGDELLSGRVQDQNTPYLIKELSLLGIEIKSCILVPDVHAEIISALRYLETKVDLIFTSGGIGPTPDDITMESIATAFNVKLLTHPKLKSLIKNHFKNNCNETHFKMAQIPKGSLLIPTSNASYPQVKFRNILIFPGVPKFLVQKFQDIKPRLQRMKLPEFREIIVQADEIDITPVLQEAISRFPEIKLGSYPKFKADISRVQITLQHEECNYVKAVEYFLKEKLKPAIS